MRKVLLLIVLFTAVRIEAQVPFDTNGVPILKEIKRWDYNGGMMWSLTSTQSMCGLSQNDVVVTSFTDRGAQTYSQVPPFDTLSTSSWTTAPKTGWIQEIDYDGISPLEYVNQCGEVLRCQGDSRLPNIRIDSIDCIAIGISTRYSCDVDDNGISDVVLYPKDATVNFADVVLSGAEYGMSCNRVMSLPRKSADNGLLHQSTWIRFYRDYDGTLRMLIGRTIAEGELQGLYLYRVELKRVGVEFSVEYKVTDSVVVMRDQQLSPYAQYLECLVNDTVTRCHYAINQWTSGYRYGKDILNKPVVSVYRINGGRFEETQAIIGVLGYFKSFDNSYDGGDPMVTYYSDGDFYYYMSRISNLDKPVGKIPWLVTAPFQAFIQDQNADGKSDFLIATDHLPGQLRLYDMSILTTPVEEHIDLRSMKSSVIDESHTLTAYPNPAADELIVIWNDHHDDKNMYNTGTLTLRNHIGSVVASTSISRNERIVLETNQLPSGQYLLQMQTFDGKASNAPRTVMVIH